MSSSSRRLRAASAGLCALLSSIAVVRSARADGPSKAECASAYEKSQEQRASGKLKTAHEQLQICANEACPAFVQTDCSQWVAEVGREIPTVTFSVSDKKGDPVTAAKVSVDGEEVASEINDTPIELDPGTHKFRFEVEGMAPISQELEIRKGEKDRVISASFRSQGGGGEVTPAASPYGDAPPAKDAPKEEAESGKPGPLRPYAYVAGGVGVAGIAGFIAFGAMGHSKQSDLDSSCGPTHTCAKSDVDSIKTKYLLADISLGVGIVGLGTGVALFFLSQPKSSAPSEDASTHFDVQTRSDGAIATVSGKF
jgi:hypothetical protein